MIIIIYWGVSRGLRSMRYHMAAGNERLKPEPALLIRWTEWSEHVTKARMAVPPSFLVKLWTARDWTAPLCRGSSTTTPCSGSSLPELNSTACRVRVCNPQIPQLTLSLFYSPPPATSGSARIMPAKEKQSLRKWTKIIILLLFGEYLAAIFIIYFNIIIIIIIILLYYYYIIYSYYIIIIIILFILLFGE